MSTKRVLLPEGHVTVTGPAEEPGSSFPFVGELQRWGRDIVFASLTAILFVVFVVQPVKVEGTSMEPKLQAQDRIFVNKLGYHFLEVERADIVVFWFPKDQSKSFIKRVVGLPRETVEIRSGIVYIDGERLQETYVPSEYFDFKSYPPKIVPYDSFFVLGDHRSSSNDSRSWGFVPKNYIFGEAIFRYWPPSKVGMIY